MPIECEFDELAEAFFREGDELAKAFEEEARAVEGLLALPPRPPAAAGELAAGTPAPELVAAKPASTRAPLSRRAGVPRWVAWGVGVVALLAIGWAIPATEPASPSAAPAPASWSDTVDHLMHSVRGAWSSDAR